MRVGAYALSEVLGSGGMGTVYRATGPDGTAVAVKRMQLDADEETRRRFLREARVRIEHPNVVKVMGAGFDADGRPYLVLELLLGESLREIMARGPLAPDAAVDVAVQACRGLAAAHESGLVHRDVKPANLFRCKDGTIKVLDFGVARAATDATWLTRSGVIVGTPGYLAPEQARGEPDVDLRADLWAIGAILYEALSGRAPFGRANALGTLLAVVTEEPPALSSVASGVPDELARIVHRCLRKEREARFESAGSLAAALAEADLSRPSTAPSERPTGRAERRLVALVLARGVRDVAALRRIVSEGGGSFVPLRGRLAVALFGGEGWEGDELGRAARAALLALCSADAIALSSGYVTRDGDLISGDALLAAERGSEAGLAGVAVDPATARALAPAHRLLEREPELFELVPGEPLGSTSGTPFERASPFVGRRTELDQIDGALEVAVRERRPAAVLVSGPPGIGKTRLVEEARRRLPERSGGEPVHLLVGRAEPLSRGAAFSLVAGALRWHAQRVLLRSAPTDEPVARTPLDRILDSLGGTTTDDERPFLAEILGVPTGDSDALLSAREDPRLMTDRLRLAVLGYLAGLSRSGPVVLLLEDLQWADAASLELLDELLLEQEAVPLPLLLLATARSGAEEMLAGHDVIRLALRPLADADVQRLAAAVAGAELAPVLLAALIGRAGGNPLFVEQIVLALREDGRLTSGRTPPEELPLPLSVEAAVHARLDHLPEPEKELCRCASIYRRPVRTADMEALGVEDVSALLVRLAARDLVLRVSDPRGGRGRSYAFRSPLVGEVAYRTLTDDRKRELHRRASHYLRSLPDPDAEEVAVHCEMADVPVDAAFHYAEGAKAAARRGDSRAVLRCADRALALGAPARERFAIQMARADAAGFLGRSELREAALGAALETAGDGSERARALTELSEIRLRRGRTDEVLATIDGAIEAARAAGDRDTWARATARKAIAFIYTGRLDEAAAAMEEARAAAGSVRPLTGAFLADVAGYLAATRGDPDERRRAFAEAAALYAKAGDIRRAGGAETNLADALNRLGAHDEAAAALEAALEKCRRIGNRLTEGYALVNLGYALTIMGRIDEALGRLEQAAVIAADAENAHLRLAARVYLLRARLARGEDVSAEALDAAGEAERVGQRSLVAVALTLAAQATLAAGDAPRARELSGRALALRDELGSLEEDEAEVFLAHARALAACGATDEARAVVERGRARIDAIASRIADPAYRARYLESVPAHRALANHS